MSEGYAFDQAWEKEKIRLRGIEQWLDHGTMRLLQRAGLREGASCLEVGGGHGSVARAAAALAGKEGRVLVTDLDTTLLEPLVAEGIDVRRHDILAGPPEPEAFDVAHARMVVGWIREREKALRNMIDALRPGGVLMIEEIDHVSQMALEPSPAYERIVETMLSAMRLVGYDMQLGRRLPWLLHSLGLEDVEAEGRVEYGRLGQSPGIDMFRLTLERMRDAFVAVGPATAADVDDTIVRLGDPAFENMPPTVVAAWGRKPA